MESYSAARISDTVAISDGDLFGSRDGWSFGSHPSHLSVSPLGLAFGVLIGFVRRPITALCIPFMVVGGAVDGYLTWCAMARSRRIYHVRVRTSRNKTFLSVIRIAAQLGVARDIDKAPGRVRTVADHIRSEYSELRPYKPNPQRWFHATWGIQCTRRARRISMERETS